MRTETFDVVILGGGAAGLSAALAAVESAAAAGSGTGDGGAIKVAVVSKVYPMRSHTVAAEGGAAGVHRASDSFELHQADTLRAGAGLAEPDAVRYVVEQAPVELARLERLGMPFSRTDDGDVETRRFGGMSEPRTWFAADKTGFHLLHTLFQTCLQYPNLKFFNEYLALELMLPQLGGNIGVITYSQGEGEPVLFLAPAVVLATGGYARAWGTSTNAAIVTGDGHALALRAGLPLRDMEFVQWHPTCLPGTGILITEAARGEGGILLDKDGARYLADYGLGPVTDIGHPQPRQMELGPRDALSQAFASAVADGRTRKLPYTQLNQFQLDAASAPMDGDAQSEHAAQTDGGVRMIDVVDLDLTHLGPGVLKEKLPLILELAKRYARVDATTQPIPICPAAHYTMGGIPTDVAGRVLDAAGTPVPGLYAAGECASTGLHGANRLGSNSLVETLVMGRTAGAEAAAVANAAGPLNGVEAGADDGAPKLWAKWEAMRGNGSENHYAMQAELGVVLDQNFGIRLSESGLAQAAAAIERLKQRYANVRVDDAATQYNTDWQQAIELGFMLDCAAATVAAAQARHESRGAFQRTDYPETSAEAKHSLFTLAGGVA